MANREKGYGLTKEVAARMDAKYSEEDEQIVVAWMREILGDQPSGPGRAVRKQMHSYRVCLPKRQQSPHYQVIDMTGKQQLMSQIVLLLLLETKEELRCKWRKHYSLD